MRSFNAAAESDLRNAATAQEAYFVDAQTYLATPTSLIGATYGLYTSQNVVIPAGSSNASQYTMTSYHGSGNKTYTLIGPGGSITTN
jgi:Tfp pilus assembly protein PilE